MRWKQIVALIVGALAIVALLELYNPTVLLSVGVLLLAILHLVPGE